MQEMKFVRKNWQTPRKKLVYGKKYCKKNTEKVAPELSGSNLPWLPLKSVEDLIEMEELLSSSQEEKVIFY